MQDNLLLSGSIIENLRIAKADATDDEMILAAQAANAEEFILGLPDSYDTYLGENGVSLSGGQKQRISIARAILRNPQILILDEATSALDNESEMLIQEALDRLSKGRTVISIAHRLSTI
jgi:ABC-type multidrug transport system fused ATPase/permease subunit